MEEANDQSEFNLHNLDGAHGGLNLSSALRMVQLAVAAGGALLPPLTGLNRSPVRRVAYLRALSPPVVLVPAFAMAFAVRLADLGLRVINHLPDALIYYLEWGEFCLDLGLAGMAVCARTTLLGRFQGRHSHRTANGRAVAASPLTPMVVILAAGCLLVTFVLAMMTMQTGILPGNVKG
jgi:hypothetical protein